MSGNRGGRRGGRACGVAGFRFALVVGVFALATSAASAQANVWAGATSSDWADGTNWSLGLVPTNAHDVDIPPGTPNAPIVGGATNAAAGTLAVQPAATLLLAAGGSLTVAATTTVDGTLTFAGATGDFGGDVGGTGLLDAGGGAFTFGGSISVASLTFTGTPLYTFTAVAGPAAINLAGLPDVAVNAANDVTFSLATTVAGGLLVSGAGAAVYTQFVVVAGAASVTNGSLQLDGAGAGMNTFSSGLVLAGGDVDADGDLDVVGPLTIGAGDTLTLNGVAALTAGGDVTGAGTLAAGGGSHQFTGSVTVGTLTFSGAPIYTYSATAGAATVSAPTSLPEVDVNAANDVAFTTATQVGGALTVSAGSATFSQALTVTGDVDVGAGGILLLDAAAATNLLSGALTVTGSMTVQGDLSVAGLITVAGTLALPTGALTASDSFVGAGQFDAGTGSHFFDGSFTVATLTFSGAPTYSFTAAATPGGAAVGQATLPGVSASNTNALTFSTTTSVQGALAMIGPGLTTFSLAPTVTGDVTVSNGTLAFDAGATLQGSLSVSGGATASAAGDLDVATFVSLGGALTMTAGDFSAGGTVQGGGAASFPGAPATQTFGATLDVGSASFGAGATANFTATAGLANVSTGTLPNVVVASANPVVFISTTTVNGDLTNSGASFAQFLDPIVVTGAVAVNAGTIFLVGSGGGGNDLQGTVNVAVGAALVIAEDATIGGNATVNGTLAIDSGAALTANGDVTGSGAFSGDDGDHTFHGSFTVTTQTYSVTANGPRYTFDPSVAPVTVSSATLPDVRVDGGFNVTFTAATLVEFDLDNQGAALGIFQQPVTVTGSVSGAFSFVGGATMAGLTVPLGATTTFTGGTVTVNGPTTVDGTLDLTAGAAFAGNGDVGGVGTFNGGTGAHTFAGSLTVATLTFTPPTTYTFTAAAGPATVSPPNLPNVLVNAANDVAFTGAPGVALASLTVLGTGAANFAQYATIAGLTSVSGGGVALNGTGAGANSLAVASFLGGSLTAADDTDLSGALTVGPGFSATMTDPASTLTLAQGAGIGGTLDLTSGATLDAGGAVLGVGTLLAGSGSHTFGGSLTIATLTFTGTPTYLFTATAATATVSIASLPATTVDSANNVAFTGTTSVGGALTKTGAGTASFASLLTVAGAVVVNGGLLSLDGTGAGSNALQSTVDLVGGDLTVADDVTITGATTLAAGTTFTMTGGADLTTFGDVTGAGTFAGDSGDHSFGGSLTTALTFTGAPNPPIYTFGAVAGPATVTPAALPGLIVNSANDVAFTNATSVASTLLQIGTGTTTFSAAVTVALGVQCTTGTLAFAAGATLQSALTITGAGIVNSAGDLSVALFTGVAPGAQLNVTAGNFSAAGDVVGAGAATFAGAPSVHVFAGDLNMTNVTFGAGGTARFTATSGSASVFCASLPNVVVDASFPVTFLPVTQVNGTLTKDGTGTATFGLAATVTQAVTVNAGDLVVAAGPSAFQSTFTANGGELTLAADVQLTIADDVVFAGTSTFDAGANSSLFAGGDWTAVPTVNPTAGFVLFLGTPVTIGGTAPINFANLTVANGGTASAAADVAVDQTLSVSTGALSMGAFAVSASSAFVTGGAALSFTTGVGTFASGVAVQGSFDGGSGSHNFAGGLSVGIGSALTFPNAPYPVWNFTAATTSSLFSIHPLPSIRAAPATQLRLIGTAVTILGDLDGVGPGSVVVIAPTTTGGDATFDGGTFATALGGSLDVAGDFAFNDPATTTGLVDLQVAGNYSAGAGFAPTSGTVLFDGAAQTLDSTAGNDELAFFVVRFAGTGVKSVVAPTGRVAVGSTAQVSSALDMGATGRLDVEDDFTVDPGAVFAVGATSHSFGADFLCDGAINSAPGAFFAFDQSAFTPAFAAVRADATLAPLPNVIVSRAESVPGTPTHFVQFGQGLPLSAPVAGGAPVRTTGDFTLASGGVVIPTQLSATPLATSALQVGGSALLFGGSMTFLGSDSVMSVGGSALYPTFGAPEVGTQIAGTANVVCGGSWFSNDRFAPSNGYVRFTGAAVGANGQIGHRAPGGVVRFVALDVVDGGYALQSAVEALAATVAGGTGAVPIVTVPAGASLASPRTADTAATGPTPVGAVKVGASATSVGVLNVGDATTAGGALFLGANATLDVAAGSAFRLVGAPGQPAVLDRLAGGRYRATVHGVVQARDFVVRGPARTGFVIDSDAQIPALPGETFGFGRGAFDQASTLAPAVLLDARAAAGQTLVLPELRFDFDGVQTPPTGVFAATTAPGNNIPGTPGIGLGFVQFAQAAGTLFNVEIDPANQISWTAAFTVVSNFAAVGSANKAVLAWHCVSEGPIQSFVVARGASASGPFVDLPLEAAPGLVNYEYCDDNLAPGAYHYVLRQRNADGSVTDVGALAPATTSPAVYAASLAAIPHTAVVGAGGFADVASAVASLAGAPYGAVYLAPGTYAAPTLSTVPAGGLSFVALPGGAVVFDTTAGPFTVATSLAGGVVELHGVEIGLAGSTGQALRIVAAKPVLLTDVVVRGSGPASAFVDATFGAAFQRATLVGGLEARNGAVVSFAGGSAAAAKADLGAKIRTAGAALGATSATNGGVVDAYAGVMPDLVAPRAAPVGLTFDVDLAAAPFAPYVLLVAFGAAYQPLPGVAEMPLLLPLAATLPLWVGACDATGLATFPVPLPADASVLGLTATFQAGVVGLGAAPLRLSTAAVVSVTP